MGFLDFFKSQPASGVDATTGGRCNQCVHCREMPMVMGGGLRNVFVCELSERDDGCVRRVGPNESCTRFRANSNGLHTTEDPLTKKVWNLLENITEDIRVKFSCQVLPPEIILGEKWKNGNQSEIGVIDFVRMDNNWTVDEFETFIRTKKVYICSVHVRIDTETLEDNIVSPTYGHWSDWDLEAWMEEKLHVPVLAVGIKRDSNANPYRCFRFVVMDK